MQARALGASESDSRELDFHGMLEDDGGALRESHSLEPSSLHSRLVRAARRWVRSPQDAEDAVQQAWLEILSRPPERGAGLGSLLRLVTVRAAIKLNHRERRRSERERSVARSESVAEEPGFSKETAARVLALMERLDEPYASVLRLRHVEDLSLDEIALKLGRPAATVRSQHARGLQMLRTRLGGTDRARDKRRGILGFLGLLLPRRGAVTPKARLAGTACLGALLVGLVVLPLSLPRDGRAVEVAASPAHELPQTRETEPASRDQVQREPIASSASVDTGGASAPVANGRVVSGLVVDSEGNPIPGAEVWTSLGVTATSKRLVATTDAAGRFEARDLEAEGYIHASKAGFHATRLVLVASAAAKETIELRFGPTAPVEGTVLLPDGTPAAGANVGFGSPFMEESIQSKGRETAGGLIDRRAPVESTTTDAEGHFTLLRNLAERQRVRVEHESTAPWIGFCERSENRLLIRLPRSATITASVLAPDGSPLAGVQLRAKTVMGEPLGASLTDSDGRFSLGRLPPGPVVIWGEGRQGETALSVHSQLELAEGADVHIAPLLADDSRTISGRVRLGEQAPSGWSVTLTSEEGDREGATRRASLSSDGRFSFGDCRAGRHTVRVYAPGELECALVSRGRLLPGTEEVLVELPRDGAQGAVSGTLASPESGLDPRNTRIELRGALLEQPRLVTLDDSGRFATQGLNPGKYSLVGWSPEGGSWTIQSFELSPGATLDLGRLGIPSPGSLLVELEGLEAGTALQQIDIRVVSEHAQVIAVGDSKPEFVEKDFAARRITIHRLMPGRYRYSVAVPGYAECKGDFELPEAEEHLLRLLLRPGNWTFVTIASPRSLWPDETLEFELIGPQGNPTRIIPVAREDSRELAQLKLELPLAPHELRVRCKNQLTGEIVFHGETVVSGPERTPIRSLTLELVEVP